MKQNLENYLCNFHNKKYVNIVGNGTTALYLAIKSTEKKIKYVGIPNNSCIHLPIAVKLAKCTPVFLDIEKNGYGVDLDSLKKSKIDCLINVHAYGKPSKIDIIRKICIKRKIFLIEDLAVAQGAYFKKKPLGSFGQVSILSFGKGKVVDAGIGGAFLTDSLNIYEKSKKLSRGFALVNNTNIKNINYVNNLHTKFYNDYYLYNKNVNFKKFKMAINLKSKFFLFNISQKHINNIYKKCTKLDSLIKIRKKNFSILRNKIIRLKKKNIYIPKMIKGEVPWRLNIFFKDFYKRNYFLKVLLSEKINASSWYSGLDLFFYKNLNLKNSDLHSKSILNLWINNKCDKGYQKKIIKFINQL